MSDAPKKEKTPLTEKREEQLALARIKAVEAIKKKAASREEKRIEIAKQRLLQEQGAKPLESVAIAKDPSVKAAKWNARKQEIIDEVQSRINELGLVSRKDPPSMRRKNVGKRKVKSPSPITSDADSESDSASSEEEVERPPKKIRKKPIKQQSEPLLRLYD
jgi:hypothetical protein